MEQNLMEKYALFFSLHSAIQTALSFQITRVLHHSLVKSLHCSPTQKKQPEVEQNW